MPNRRSSIKELRKNYTRHMRNMDFRTDLKKTIKKFIVSVNNKNSPQAQEDLKLVHKKLDKAAKHHLINKNTASRRKSTFSRMLNQAAAAKN